MDYRLNEYARAKSERGRRIIVRDDETGQRLFKRGWSWVEEREAATRYQRTTTPLPSGARWELS